MASLKQSPSRLRAPTLIETHANAEIQMHEALLREEFKKAMKPVIEHLLTGRGLVISTEMGPFCVGDNGVIADLTPDIITALNRQK